MADVRNEPDTSVVIPAFNEAASVDAVVQALAASARWREILVIDDGSTDDTGARARAAGAIVIRHPYNKGNGAAVKTGIRHATGRFVLIADADGQHQPADASRPVRGQCRRWSSARVPVGLRRAPRVRAAMPR